MGLWSYKKRKWLEFYFNEKLAMKILVPLFTGETYWSLEIVMSVRYQPNTLQFCPSTHEVLPETPRGSHHSKL